MVRLENKSENTVSHLGFVFQSYHLLPDFTALENVFRFIPLYTTAPEVGVSKIPRICNSVLLPAPDAPTITTISPFSTDKLILCKTGNVRSPFEYSLYISIACNRLLFATFVSAILICELTNFCVKYITPVSISQILIYELYVFPNICIYPDILCFYQYFQGFQGNSILVRFTCYDIFYNIV